MCLRTLEPSIASARKRLFVKQIPDEHDIYFMHGIPAKVRLGRTMALLGEELIIMGAMERGVLDNAVESSRRLGVLLGEFLVGENLVSRDVLARALEAQLLKKVAALANLPPETSYAYYRDVNTIAEWGGREITLGGPLNPILATVRAWHDRARVRATLSRVGKHPLVFHEEADLASLLLTPQEKVVIDTIRNESPSSGWMRSVKTFGACGCCALALKRICGMSLNCTATSLARSGMALPVRR